VFYNPAAPAYDYDPEGAKRLLAQQGFADHDGDGVLEDSHGNPVRFTLKTAANSNLRVQLANFVRDDLARVGIQCTLATVDPNSMVAAIQDTYDYDAALGGLASVIPPDPGLGANFYRSSGATHFWNARQPRPATPEDAQLDSLFEALNSITDLPARRRISAEMERVIGEQCWVTWLPVNDLKVPVRNRFGNLQPSAIRHRLLWNIETVFVKPAPRKP
jgi:peptide/nickel transport system substrate-binding protein